KHLHADEPSARFIDLYEASLGVEDKDAARDLVEHREVLRGEPLQLLARSHLIGDVEREHHDSVDLTIVAAKRLNGEASPAALHRVRSGDPLRSASFGQSGTVRHVQALEQSRHLLLHGLLAHAKLPRDLLVLESANHAVEYLGLPRCQACLAVLRRSERSAAHVAKNRANSRRPSERAGGIYT